MSAQSVLTDIELVDQLVRGVPGAFEEFFGRYERLINHCVRVRTDAAEVEDLVQSVFERLVERDYRILRLWQRGTSLPIYLKIVIRNFVTDSHRTNRSQQKIKHVLTQQALIDAPIVEEGVTPAAPIASEEITPAIELKELRSLGVQAWAELEPRDRFIVCGKLHRELSNEAMAERLSVTVGTLRTALSRAQVRFLLSLKALAPEYFPAQV